ncbi:DUF2971 domain-containing protein [Aquirufa nivalisilvae]|uniref:DUF2971 domain-containing protein n=1 Tax=Aquirufa nivalisilvae TaxID=2516557 RepID=UPI0022A955B2|nr:DUF2971 domain-containing protein [Aquirufa nivalisilvae]MCZ2479440.1 DUF2971 domain-containing protein [Aquirufa nivalisilvae]
METTEKYPKIVYKYRAWKRFQKKTLTDFELYLASPKDFNDPFDCKIPTNYKAMNEKEKIAFADKFIFKNKSKLLAERKDLIEEKRNLEFFLMNNIGALQKKYEEVMFKEYDDRFGVLSLSKNWNNILMWSHYGDRHNGYCIGFHNNLLIDSKKFGYIGAVNYQKNREYPLIHPLFDPMDKVETVLKCTHYKDYDWAYEEEYRFTRYFLSNLPTQEDRLIKIDSSFIAEVIIGLRTPEAHKAKIIKICKEKGINVFQAKQVEFKFLLDRDEI